MIVAIAVLLAIGMAHYLTKGTQYQKHVLDLSIYMFVGGIVVARFWEVFFFQWNDYSKHLLEILFVWNGGLSIQGSILGGLISMLIYVKRHQLHFWSLADDVIPATVFGQGVGRIACFLNGDAYGSPTGSNFGIVYPPGTPAYDM